VGITYEGEPALTLELVATSTRTFSEAPNVAILLDGAVFDGNVSLYPVTELEYVAHLTLLPALPVGVQEGTIEVRLCHDDPVECAQPFDGSPWHVPYEIDVRSSADLPTDVSNGDFESGVTGWGAWANQGSLSCSAPGGVLKATIGSPGPDGTSMGISYDGGINLEEGKTYQLSFDAKADGSRTMVAMVTENGRDLNGNGFPYDDYIIPAPVPNLTTTMQTFSYTFTMPVTNRSAGVVFYLGGSGANVYIDNVSVTEAP
jgi:hypothetical protein